jgi:uncharacterized membrane protein YwzB
MKMISMNAVVSLVIGVYTVLVGMWLLHLINLEKREKLEDRIRNLESILSDMGVEVRK